MSENMKELMGSQPWKWMYDELWKMWKEGLDTLQKAEDGKTAERAKERMKVAEELARLPLKKNVLGGQEEKERYREKVKVQGERVGKQAFVERVEGKG